MAGLSSASWLLIGQQSGDPPDGITVISGPAELVPRMHISGQDLMARVNALVIPVTSIHGTVSDTGRSNAFWYTRQFGVGCNTLASRLLYAKNEK